MAPVGRSSRASRDRGRPTAQIPRRQTHLSPSRRTPQPVGQRKRDGLRGGRRKVAGGAPRASSPVVSRSASGSSLDRGITRPSGALSPPPGEVGTGRRKRRPPSRRTPSEWAGERSAPLATTGPSEVGGSRRVGRSPTRPVLKHGPRSLTCARVNGS